MRLSPPRRRRRRRGDSQFLVQKCLIYQMSTPKRRQHLSSSMTMLMTTATPTATPAAPSNANADIVNTSPQYPAPPFVYTPPRFTPLLTSPLQSSSKPASARGSVLKNERRFPHTVLFIVAIYSSKPHTPPLSLSLSQPLSLSLSLSLPLSLVSPPSS